MPSRFTQEEVIERFIKIHGNRYDYSNVIYINSKSKVKIICKKHGEFEQRPNNHLNGEGCPRCGGSGLYSQDDMISEFNKKHGYFFDYSKAIYVNQNTLITIICPIHGEFEQYPKSHKKYGCPKCGYNKNRIKLSQEEAISNLITVHGNRYDYSKTIYKGSTEKMIIICPKHGEFEQTYATHRGGSNCPKCVNEKKIGARHYTVEDVIRLMNKVHNNFYDYSKITEYKNNNAKLPIICPIHGEFEQSFSAHTRKHGCPKCSLEKNGRIKRKTQEDFIKQINIIHNNFYDYSNVIYTTSKSKIKIICPIHGEFEQLASNHLRGDGCPICNKGISNTKGDIMYRFIKKHDYFYDYSNFKNYTNVNQKIKIICPIHGEFEQIIRNHLRGDGCPICGGCYTLTTELFKKKAKKIHGLKFDYSKTIYGKNNIEKVIITCPKHGDFKQSPQTHLSGGGCHKCNTSRGETKVRVFLEVNDIEFIQQHTFEKCKNKRKLPFDFYLPEYNICIEYQGTQHYRPFDRFGGSNEFKSLVERDKIKEKFCRDNNIKLIVIPYTKSVSKILKKELL